MTYSSTLINNTCFTGSSHFLPPPKAAKLFQILTFRWRLVGCMYCPSVRQSTPASRSSAKRDSQTCCAHAKHTSRLGGHDVRLHTPVMVLSICCSVSPSPSMMDVLVSTVGLTVLACLRTLKDWSKFALGSRTCLEHKRQKMKRKKWYTNS